MVCAYDVFEKLRDRYPTRKVEPDARCWRGEAYYMNGAGHLRRLVVWDETIWAPVSDTFPPLQRQVWPRK